MLKSINSNLLLYLLKWLKISIVKLLILESIIYCNNN